MSESQTDYTISGSYTLTTPTITFTTANQTLRFSPFIIDQIANPSLTITIKNLARPRECKTTGTFTINTYRSGLFLMDYSTCCAIALKNRGNLSATTPVLSSNSRLISGVSYQINVTTVVITNLVTTDQIRIEFPSEFSQQISAANNSTVCNAISITGINNASNIKTPTCSVTSNSVLLSSFLKTNIFSS